MTQQLKASTPTQAHLLCARLIGIELIESALEEYAVV